MVSFPLRSALPAQSCPQAFICWRHVEKDTKGKSAGTQQLKKVSWDLHQTGISERKENTGGICWTWCTYGRLFLVKNPTPQQLKTLKNPVITSSCLVRAPFFHQSQDPCCALCPYLSWALSVHLSSAKLDSKLSSSCLSLSLCHLRGSSPGECLTLFSSSEPGEPSHTAVIALLQGRAPSAGTWRL